MLKKLTATILKGEAGTTTIAGWLAGFVGIVIIRTLLEQFSSPPYFGVMDLDVQTLIEYSLSYLTPIFFIAIVVSVFAKQKNCRALNLALYWLPFIFVVPIIDMALSIGHGSIIAYLFDSHTKLLFDFLTFFGPLKNAGITIGMRIELFIILCGIGWFVWNKTKKITAAAGAAVAAYSSLFVIAAIPGILYTIFGTTRADENTFSFLRDSITNSNIPANTLNAAFSYSSYGSLLDAGSSVLISQALFVLLFIAIAVWSWYTHKSIFKEVLRNARPERVLSYISLIALGALYAQTMTPIVFTWVEGLGLIVLSLSWFSACMYAIHTNDLADIDIDTISNPDRPLPKHTLTPQMMRDIGFGWLVLSLVGAYIVGYYPFFMMLIFTSAYYLHSAPPLRLKRVPILSSFLNSLTCLATVLAGFFFLSPDKMLTAFPTLLVIGIIVVFTLSSNFRDIKDIEGDRAAGIQTLPVISGTYGKQVVGVLLALGFLLVPIFLSFYTLYLFALPAAVIGYRLCVKQPYKERYLFILYFVFYALTALLMLPLLSLLK